MRGRRDIVARHLRRVHGESLQGAALRRAVDRVVRLVRALLGRVVSHPGAVERRDRRGLHPRGLGNLREGLADGTGVILALPHLGGWEWAGRWIADCGWPITVVVEPLEPPELFEWFAEFRRSLGMNVVPLGPGAASAAIKALKANDVVCLLCDRDIGGGGVEVEFFGERTTLPAGPATLALRTGAPVLPTAVYFRPDGGHLGKVGAPLDIDASRFDGDDVARHHAAARVPARGADPHRARAVAPAAAELAERPRLPRDRDSAFSWRSGPSEAPTCQENQCQLVVFAWPNARLPPSRPAPVATVEAEKAPHDASCVMVLVPSAP